MAHTFSTIETAAALALQFHAWAIVAQQEGNIKAAEQYRNRAKEIEQAIAAIQNRTANEQQHFVVLDASAEYAFSAFAFTQQGGQQYDT